MKKSEFFKDHIASIFFLVAILVTIEIFLLPFPEVDLAIRIYIPVSILIGYFLILFVEYEKKKLFYKHLIQYMDTLDQKYLVKELIEKPDFIEGKIFNEILIDIEKSMLENVNQYKQINQEYQEYIELWIHEIKLPIATSKMIVENNPTAEMKSIDEELDKIDEFIEQALYYARSNNVEQDYMIKKTNLAQVISQVIRKDKKSLIASQMKVVVDENTNLEVYTDSKWIVFILNQILNNAIKYRKDGTKEPSKIEIYAKEDKVVVFIEDNGIGIHKEEIKRVFDKGFTGTNGRKEQKSTGIGLYLCKKLCKKLGHSICLQSTIGKGTKVEITFPKGSYIVHT